MIERGDAILQQNGDLVMNEGDILSFVGDREAILHARFFNENEYAFSLIFRQMWSKFMRGNMKKIRKMSRNKRRS